MTLLVRVATGTVLLSWLTAPIGLIELIQLWRYLLSRPLHSSADRFSSDASISSAETAAIFLSSRASSKHEPMGISTINISSSSSSSSKQNLLIESLNGSWFNTCIPISGQSLNRDPIIGILSFPVLLSPISDGSAFVLHFSVHFVRCCLTPILFLFLPLPLSLYSCVSKRCWVDCELQLHQFHTKRSIWFNIARLHAKAQPYPSPSLPLSPFAKLNKTELNNNGDNNDSNNSNNKDNNNKKKEKQVGLSRFSLAENTSEEKPHPDLWAGTKPNTNALRALT